MNNPAIAWWPTLIKRAKQSVFIVIIMTAGITLRDRHSRCTDGYYCRRLWRWKILRKISSCGPPALLLRPQAVSKPLCLAEVETLQEYIENWGKNRRLLTGVGTVFCGDGKPGFNSLNQNQTGPCLVQCNKTKKLKIWILGCHCAFREIRAMNIHYHACVPSRFPEKIIMLHCKCFYFIPWSVLGWFISTASSMWVFKWGGYFKLKVSEDTAPSSNTQSFVTPKWSRRWSY